MESTLYRILVMENDSSSTQKICGMLENNQNSPFQIVLAKSGQGVVPSLVYESVDALLLDMHSLNGAGLACVRELHSQFNSLPILALVPASDHALGHRVLEVGAAEYLVKENLSSELLQKSLQYAIERTRAEARPASPRSAFMSSSKIPKTFSSPSTSKGMSLS